MAEIIQDFKNGYGIIKLYSNAADGDYGDVFNTKEDVEREYPDAQIIEGYAVFDIETGYIPESCRDWNDSIKDALKEYMITIVPGINKEKEIERIRNIHFLERSGAEQMAVFNYWYSINTNDKLWDYLGMSFEEFDLWRTGELTLNDGSYKQMDESIYKVNGRSLELARVLLNCDTTTMIHSLIYKDLRESIYKLNDNIVGFGPLIMDPNNKYIFFFDVGDDLAAIVSENACYHKEDIAYYMNFAEIKPTEKNFQKVFAEIVNIASNSKEVILLSDCVMKAINIVKDEKKQSLDNRITAAKSKKDVVGDSLERMVELSK